MKLNNKGVSLTEMLVSIALISVLLIFLVNLFVKVRGDYNNSKINAEHEMIKSNILKAVYTDLNEYEYAMIYCYDENNNPYIDNIFEIRGTDNCASNKIVFEYDAPRLSNPSQNITKVLEYDEDKSVLKYGYVRCDSTNANYCTENITSKERTENVSRNVPNDTVIGKFKLGNPKNFSHSDLSSVEIREVKIPIMSQKGESYDINIYYKESFIF